MSSALPTPIKLTVQAAVHELAATRAADPEACIPPSMLLGVVTALSCPTLQAVDLLWILLGLFPRDGAHSRRNLSAALRDKAARLGRTLTAADFAADHAVQVFAHAYWGGIEAWSHGRTARIQLPKGYWGQRANQSVALCDATARFPGEPITHALLHRADYHALARRLDASGLVALAAECGLDRALRKGPAADWTAERVLAAYVTLCRTHGVTLSSDALRQLSGPASSLRAYGVRAFGSHAGLVRAAMAADPAIRPLDRPTTPDGIVLGSWAEVRVYAALRSGLAPDTVIRLHVPLAPELPRHSCDLVVSRKDHSAWVEVLMVSQAGMRDPNANATVQRYARRWQAKTAWYAARSATLVMVEPDAVFDAARLEAMVAEVRRHLEPPADGCSVSSAPQPLCPTGGCARPRRYWTMGKLREAVQEVAGTSGNWPTDAAMNAAGYGGAMNAIKKRRLRARLAGTCGLRLVHVRGVWTEARVVEALVTWVHAHGAYPTIAALQAGGEVGLGSARCRLFASRGAELRATVERRCGLALGGRMLPGSTATPEALAALLRPVCEQLGRFPNAAEMAAAGLPSTVYAVTSRRYGVAAMAARMGVPYAGPERLTHDEAVAVLLTAAEPSLLPGVPSRITTTMIRERLGSKGIGMLRQKVGSIADLRAILAGQARTVEGDG